MVDKLIDILLLFLWCVRAAEFFSCSFCMISACVYNKLFLYISVPPFYHFAFKSTELLEFTSPFPLPKIKDLHKAHDFRANKRYFAYFFHTIITFSAVPIIFRELQSRQPLHLPTDWGTYKSCLLCNTYSPYHVAA